MSKEVIRPKQYRIYKPYKKNEGAASAFQLKLTLDNEASLGKQRVVELFWVATNQTGVNESTGHSMFGWDDSSKSITMKLGLPDVGELLCLFDRDKEEISLFHQIKSGNTVLKMKEIQNKQGVGFRFQMSAKRDDSLTKVGHNVSMADSKVLKQLLKDFVSLYHDWL